MFVLTQKGGKRTKPNVCNHRKNLPPNEMLGIILHYGNWGRLCVTFKRSSNVIIFMSSTELIGRQPWNAVSPKDGKPKRLWKIVCLHRLDCKWIQFVEQQKITKSHTKVAIMGKLL